MPQKAFDAGVRSSQMSFSIVFVRLAFLLSPKEHSREELSQEVPTAYATRCFVDISTKLTKFFKKRLAISELPVDIYKKSPRQGCADGNKEAKEKCLVERCFRYILREELL
jgi:hypothetical protein